MVKTFAVAAVIAANFSRAFVADAHKEFTEIAFENGWATESYTVTTSDGYVSQMYRIPGRFGEAVGNKPAVLMMHGLECDMNFWIANDADLAPAFILADEGYDVWLGNNRGTRYSQSHLTLDTDSEAFWDFDWEQMGLYDVPAAIETIQAHTGQSQITYVGHSEGTTQFFAAASLIPEYFEENVNLAVLLAPVSQLANVEVAAMQKMAGFWREMQMMTKYLGLYDMFNADWLEQDAMQDLCGIFDNFCADLLSQVADMDTSVDNMARFNVFLKDFPSGNGYRCLVHYAQDINKPGFHRFNYGERDNVRIYGQIEPPQYPLHENYSVPTALVAGSLDRLGDLTDVAWTNSQIEDNVVFYETYPLGHMSFAMAKDMSWLREDVVGIMNQYATNDSLSAVLQ